MACHHRIPASGPGPHRTLAAEAVRLAQPGALDAAALCSPGWAGEVAVAWRARAEAVAAYRGQLVDAAGGLDPDRVLESLLHLHHNRALGIDPARERLCCRLAHQAGLAWQARTRAGAGR